MGIGFVALFFLALLGGAAAVAASVLRGIVRRCLAPEAVHGALAEKAAFLLPMFCVVFWVLTFGIYAFVNDRVFHRDPGLGDSWYTPMPNGDVLAAIDVGDVGSIESAGGTQLVFAVTRLQVDRGWIAGEYDEAALGFGPQAKRPNKGFFLLNATTNQRQDFPTSDALRSALQQRELTLHLRPFSEVFHVYRDTWFDTATYLWALGVPLGAFAVLGWYVFRHRTVAEIAVRGA